MTRFPATFDSYLRFGWPLPPAASRVDTVNRSNPAIEVDLLARTRQNHRGHATGLMVRPAT